MKARYYSPELDITVKEFKQELKKCNWLECIGFIITMCIVFFDICAVMLLLS